MSIIKKREDESRGRLKVGDVVLCRSPCFVSVDGELKRNMKMKRAVVVAFEDDNEREIGHEGKGHPLVVIPGGRTWTKYQEVVLDPDAEPYSHSQLVSFGLKPRKLHEQDLSHRAMRAREQLEQTSPPHRPNTDSAPLPPPSDPAHAQPRISDGDLLNLTRQKHRIRAHLHSM